MLKRLNPNIITPFGHGFLMTFITLFFLLTGFISTLPAQTLNKNSVILQTDTISKQPDSKSPIRTIDLNPVVVTGQFLPTLKDKSIYSVKVLSSQQIHERAANSLGDLLKSELNIRLTQDATLGTGINLAGLSGEHIKFLIDGIPVIGRMNGSIDLSQLTLQQVDHIEIIEGPMSVAYGSNALAGVINIITIKSAQANGVSATAKAYYETIGVYNLDGQVSYKQNNQSFTLSAGRNFFGGWSGVDSGRVQQWKPREQINASAGYQFKTNRLTLNVNGNYFNELLLGNGSLLPPYFETAFDNEFRTDRYQLSTGATYKPAANHTILFTAAWSGYEHIQNTWFKDMTTLKRYPTTNTGDQDTTTFNAFTSRSQWSWQANKKFALQTGYDLDIETGDGQTIGNHLRSIEDYALFSSLNYTLLPGFEIQPGARVAYNTRFTSPVVWSFNAKYNPLQELTLRGSLASGFRAPSLKELYLDFVDINHNIHGNEQLKPENSLNANFVLNYIYQLSTGMLELEGKLFYNRINNIITLKETGSNIYNYTNIDHFKTRGLISSLTWHYKTALRVKAGIGATGQANQSADLMGVSGKFRTTVDFIGEISWNLSKPQLTFTANYKYNGHQPYLYEDNNQLKEGYTDPYNLMDLIVLRRWFNNRLETSAGIKNLFNVQQVKSLGLDPNAVHSTSTNQTDIAWGRTAFIQLVWNLTK
jgi:outer membrane receptor for ferrienterochelin and colicins